MLEKATKLEPQQLRFIISQSHQLHGIGTFFSEVVHSVSHRITHKAHHLAVGMGGDQVRITMEKKESKSGIPWKMKHLAGEGFNVTRALSLSLSLSTWPSSSASFIKPATPRLSELSFS